MMIMNDSISVLQIVHNFLGQVVQAAEPADQQVSFLKFWLSAFSWALSLVGMVGFRCESTIELQTIINNNNKNKQS